MTDATPRALELRDDLGAVLDGVDLADQLAAVEQLLTSRYYAVVGRPASSHGDRTRHVLVAQRIATAVDALDQAGRLLGIDGDADAREEVNHGR